MAFEEYKNLWVVIETEEGKGKNVGFELLTPGRQLADEKNEKLVAIVIGKNVEAEAKKAIAYGADEAILVEGDEYFNYNTDTFSYALEQLINKYKPSTILIGATNNGRDMGPRVACRIKTGLTAATIEDLKKEGLWFVCAAMDGEVMYRCNLTGPIGLVIGNEGEGVGRLVREKCDFTASIPMKGDIDSLNASVAAGVMAFEIVRQRMNLQK